MSSLIAVVTAFAAALLLGISAIVDQRSIKRVKTRRTLSRRILMSTFAREDRATGSG
jgi:hypothetical protein